MDTLNVTAGPLAHAPHAGEAEFRRLLDKLPAGAYTCNAAGLITYYNSKRSSFGAESRG